MIKPNHWSLKLFPGWVDAYTFGKTIYLRNSGISKSLMRHEKKHVEQYARYGKFVFVVVYLWQWMKCRFRYSQIPLEVEAREAEKGD
jgi:hypothetical protein